MQIGTGSIAEEKLDGETGNGLMSTSHANLRKHSGLGGKPSFFKISGAARKSTVCTT